LTSLDSRLRGNDKTKTFSRLLFLAKLLLFHKLLF